MGDFDYMVEDRPPQLFRRNEVIEDMGYGVKVISYELWSKCLINEIFGGYNKLEERKVKYEYKGQMITQQEADVIIEKGKKADQKHNNGVNFWDQGYNATNLFEKLDHYENAEKCYVAAAAVLGVDSLAHKYAYDNDGIQKWINQTGNELHSEGVKEWDKGYNATNLFEKLDHYKNAEQYYIAGARALGQNSLAHKYAYDNDGIQKWIKQTGNELHSEGVKEWEKGYNTTNLFEKLSYYQNAEQYYIAGARALGENSTAHSYAYGKNGIKKWINQTGNELYNQGVKDWEKGYKATNLFEKLAHYQNAEQYYIAGARALGENSTAHGYAYGKNGIKKWVNQTGNELHNQGVKDWEKGYNATNLFEKLAHYQNAEQAYIAAAGVLGDKSTAHGYAYDKDGIKKWINKTGNELHSQGVKDWEKGYKATNLFEKLAHYQSAEQAYIAAAGVLGDKSLSNSYAYGEKGIKKWISEVASGLYNKAESDFKLGESSTSPLEKLVNYKNAEAGFKAASTAQGSNSEAYKKANNLKNKIIPKLEIEAISYLENNIDEIANMKEQLIKQSQQINISKQKYEKEVKELEKDLQGLNEHFNEDFITLSSECYGSDKLFFFQQIAIDQDIETMEIPELLKVDNKEELDNFLMHN